MIATDLQFYLNGQPIVVNDVDPTLLLIDYLRSPEVGLTGTKLSCGQGGCGACSVMISGYDHRNERVKHVVANSCLRPLASLDGMAVTTVEGLVRTRSSYRPNLTVTRELSPVQHRIAAENGTQCGYCTSGFVMNMHAFLAERGNDKPTKQEIEEIFDGNICRCTGYRPILYAMKHFASDWTEKDEEGSMHIVLEKDVPHYDEPSADFPDELRRPPRAVSYRRGGYRWHRPLSLDALYDPLRDADPKDVKLVVGNTSIGVYDRFEEDPHVLIDISHLAELRQFQCDANEIVIGAATTYAQLIVRLDTAIKKGDHASDLRALRYMAHRTAGRIVRAEATLAGNTMLVARHVDHGRPFPSDLFTVLCALDAKVKVWPKPDPMPILEFASTYHCDPDLARAVIMSYHIPRSPKGEYAEPYKTARRRVNAHSIVNACFRVQLDANKRVDKATAVIGGIAPIAFHARGLEEKLKGQPWNAATLAHGLKALQADIEGQITASAERLKDVPHVGLSSSYQRHLAESFFYKFFLSVMAKVDSKGVSSDALSATERFKWPETRGTQSYEPDPSSHPVHMPFVKHSAFMQASGGVEYTHDIPLVARSLHGAFVTSPYPTARFTYKGGVDGVLDLLKSRFPGVVDYLTGRDVPGKNVQGTANQEPLFCEGEVSGFGQSMGLVLARDERTAIAAARHVQRECVDFEVLEPILTIAEAREAKNGIFEDNPASAPFWGHIWKITRENSNLDWVAEPGDETTLDGVQCQVVRGSHFSGSQLHFYMETQAAVAMPGEDKQIIVYASTQVPDETQRGVAATLGLKENQVDVRIKRLGGGFGGKCSRSTFIASPAALAAWKHQQPVKVALTRETDSAMVGHRHPMWGSYSLAIGTGKDDAGNLGRMLGRRIEYLIDGGSTYDCSFVVMDNTQLQADNSYRIPNYQSQGDACRTNNTSNSSMRSMGVIQGTLISEDAIEAAALQIGMPAEKIRRKNLYSRGDTTPFGQELKYCYTQEVWDYLYEKCAFAARLEKVEAFNKANRWRKRGISMIPIKYNMGFGVTFLEQAGALVEIFDGDGTVTVHQGGVEMGQGLRTKIAQITAAELNVPLDFIRVAEGDTNIIPNPTSTGASTGTNLNGGATKEACETIRARFEKFCDEQRKKPGGEQDCIDAGIDYWNYEDQGGWRYRFESGKFKGKLIWNNVVAMAYNNRLSLSAQSRFAAPGVEKPLTGLEFKNDQGGAAQFAGFTYSAACSEVEIDVLTGETTVIRADVVYDMGRSLNPAIDVGQIEGSFVQGIGYLLTEELAYQEDGPNRGALNTLNTWEYKPPTTTTIPQQLNVDLFPRSKGAASENPNLLLSSKEVGEPPMMLSTTVFFAVKRAILAARRDRGKKDWFPLEAPATVQRVREACEVEAEHLKL